MGMFNLLADYRMKVAEQAFSETVNEAEITPAGTAPDGAALPDAALSPAAAAAAKGALPGSSGLTKYIPTEVLTLFVGVISAQEGLRALQKNWPIHFRMSHVYWMFLCFSGGFFLLGYLASLKKAKEKLPSVKDWPWFRVIASSIAFGVWALSVPGTGFLPPPAASVTGVLALGLSCVLTQLEVFFEPQT